MINISYKRILTGFSIFLSITFIFAIGFISGKSTSPFSSLGVSNGWDTDNGSFAPYIQAWNLVNDSYINQPVDKTQLIQGSIKGMLDSLGDPYTSYLNPEEYAAQNAPIEGEYTGIGAWVDTSGEDLIIISPMPDSPAEAAGLKPGDKVVEINGEDVSQLEPILVLKKILGPADSEVVITIERAGEEEWLEFSIMRAVIPIPSVESEIIEKNIGYIQLFSYALTTYDEFSAALDDLLEQGAEHLIIDLRNNSGGLVDSAIDITSLFIEDKYIFIEEWGDGTRTEYTTSKEPRTLVTPLYILVNQGTASASEITAGALQDHKRAILIGNTTFGKGLIQNWMPLTGDNGAVRVTIAKWLTPNGRQIQGLGLEPDIPVDFTIEYFIEGIDPQLDKAVQIILDNK